MALIKGISLFQATSNQIASIEEDNNVIKESIYNILTTRKGEVPGKPSFGSSIHKFLFEPNLDQYWDALKLEVMKDIGDWEARAYVYNAEFASDGHSLSIFIYFISLLDFTDNVTVISGIGEP